MPDLFTMFSQVRSVDDRSDGGLGIGLALSRGLIELHGGRLDAHSEGPGKGSEFVVRLPATSQTQAAPAALGISGGILAEATTRAGRR